ncbi:hypothetical protein [Niastella vici]|uniref:hypothetical protein n=1 Tax=Niastella vici TaxID=1703345 RepID=UPI00117FBE48|nr:hypothetical protein [Niastella vici]
MRKKNKSQAHREKIEKVRHVNEFLSAVKDMIAKAAGSDIVKYIPPSEIEFLYKIRLHPVRVKAAPGESIPPKVLEFSNCLITHFFKNEQVQIGIGMLDKISLYEYFSTAFTVMLYIQRLNDDDYPRAAVVKKRLEAFAAVVNSSTHETALKEYNHFMNATALLCCNINEYLYAFKFNPSIIERGVSKAGLFSEIYKIRLPKIKVLMGEHHRPAWRLGWYLPAPELHLELISIQSEEIYKLPGNVMDVYIQSHALNRLAERLDGIEISVLHFNIYDSLCLPKVYINKHGLLLFEYAIFKNKVGYFLGEVADGKIILKTFLFLTNNGTPEADKLQTMTGLQKEDINYLAIDKLSTFLLSDIDENENVKQLFINAGCESLFKIDKEFYHSAEGRPEMSKAGLIAKYLQLGEYQPGRR